MMSREYVKHCVMKYARMPIADYVYAADFVYVTHVIYVARCCLCSLSFMLRDICYVMKQ